MEIDCENVEISKVIRSRSLALCFTRPSLLHLDTKELVECLVEGGPLPLGKLIAAPPLFSAI